MSYFNIKMNNAICVGLKPFPFSYAMEVYISWLTYIMLRLNEDICLGKLAADLMASAEISCRDNILHVKFKFKFLR